MSFHNLPAGRQIELLQLAENLSQELKHAPIERKRGPHYVSQGDRGVAKACFSNVLSFLDQGADLPQTQAFVRHLDGLDKMTAQNQRNAKADHRALKGILSRWLRAHADLDRREIHFVWAWTDRINHFSDSSR